MRIKVGLFLVAMAALLIELLLIRVFDVILNPNMGYMVITAAMFSLGLGGLFRTIRPLETDVDVNDILARDALFFGLSSLAILPVFNTLPFDIDELTHAPLTQSVFFIGMYLSLVVPFFFAGLVFTTVFSKFSDDIQILYCWDLVGAGIGSLILIPFLPLVGPGGALFFAASIAFLASASFARKRREELIGLFGAALFLLIPLLQYPSIFDFDEHMAKRGVKEARQNDHIEFTLWDPISKIDVVSEYNQYDNTMRKHIAYDGGSQSSHIYPFDGDLKKLRTRVETGYFANHDNVWWSWGVLASHYLKRDQNQSVLIIGSAGGQETKAALTFDAASVTAIELVGTVIELGKGKYADYNGNIFNHPTVTVRKDEGRTFLRGTTNKYDIIQIFSNHTSSSIAAGTGAMATTYLQTAEAYQEYFSHLKENGILHINHHIYPKMVTTAALAWSDMGHQDFQRHVVVFNRKSARDNLPTLLIKMAPWTEEEIRELNTLVGLFGEQDIFQLVEDPINPEDSFLTPDFYKGHMSTSLLESVPYRVAASTDDKPYFNFLRKYIRILEPDTKTFLNAPTAEIINSQLRKFIPMDVVHLFLTSALGILFVLVFILCPMFLSNVGREHWPGKFITLGYFSCLGMGFIILELVFIQIFMVMIGYPLYTVSTVILTLLVASGIGSLSSFRLGISPSSRWSIPFLGILFTGTCLYIFYPDIFRFGMQFDVGGRIAVAFAMIFPIGFFLGMPFPLGILSIKDMPNGAVAWAWAMNGLFTVLGGVGSVVLSIYLGFNITLLIALAIYIAAFCLFAILRSAGPQLEVST